MDRPRPSRTFPATVAHRGCPRRLLRAFDRLDAGQDAGAGLARLEMTGIAKMCRLEAALAAIGER
jgi:hypothetical protein